MSLAALAFALVLSPNGQVPTQALDERLSTAEFEVHLRLPIHGVGRFQRMSGELTGDAVKGWQVDLHIDGRSLRFDGPAWMGEATRSDDFLDVDNFPDIVLRTGTIPDGILHHGGAVTGALTLRGRTRPATFSLTAATCATPGRDCELEVKGTISRRDFGMTGYWFALRDGVDVRVRLRWLAEPTP